MQSFHVTKLSDYYLQYAGIWNLINDIPDYTYCYMIHQYQQ